MVLLSQNRFKRISISYLSQIVLSLIVIASCIVSAHSVAGLNTIDHNKLSGYQQTTAISEMSDLAVSKTIKNHFWAINDTTNSSEIMLLDQKAQMVGKIVLKSLGNHSWEDLDIFTFNGVSYIAIADIGDDYNRRKVYYIHLLPEPVVQADGSIAAVQSSSIRTIAFQYEDGPRDAQALKVDITNDQILILSKQTPTPRVYRIPLILEPKRYVYKASYLASLDNLGTQQADFQ